MLSRGGRQLSTLSVSSDLRMCVNIRVNPTHCRNALQSQNGRKSPTNSPCGCANLYTVYIKRQKFYRIIGETHTLYCNDVVTKKRKEKKKELKS